MDDHTLESRLPHERYPRAGKYPARWVSDNAMGPNVLWLAEALSQVLPLEPGMRVLDLGCGTALSSIFLAKEFDVEVWATDLWIKPTENLERIRAAGVEGRVHPIYAEARSLPFAEDFFDALVSFDSYHYFGTDDLYIGYYSRFVKPGGSIGMVVPGLVEEPDVLPPAHLESYWKWDFCSFHGPGWWRRHWEKTGLVTVDVADLLAGGWNDWLRWDEAFDEERGVTGEEAEMLRADAGRLLGFTRMTATRR